MEEPTEAKMIENEAEEKAVEVETNGEIGVESSDVVMKDNETAEVEEAVSNNNENAEDKTEDAVSDKVGGRKRKASEMKDGEEVEEGSKEKKKAEVVENVEDKNEKDSEKETTDAAATVAENEVAKKAEKDKEVVNDVDLNLPQKEFFGKGKRARIPNKRYSDILLSPPSTKSSSSKAEKVERVERVENGSGDSENEERFGRSGSPSLRKKTDMTNPSLKKPFKYGWKRELVWRATSEKGAGKMGDIYYYTPSGKKIRSMREMSDVLKGNKMLTLENFTYTKEPIGLNDPEKEIIRDAKLKVGATSLVKTVLTPKATKSKAAPAAVATKAKITSPKPSTSKAVSPKANRMNETADSKPESPKTVKGAGKKGNFKIKFPGMKSGKGKAEKMDVSDEEMEAEPTPPPVHAKNTRRSAKWSKAPTVVETPPVKAKKRAAKAPVVEKQQTENAFMEHYLQNVSYGYSTLLYIFQYLKVQDLLRAGCVCTLWRDIAGHPLLWHTVRMKNSQVHSFEGLANTLKRHGTVHLDLRKMLLPNGEEIWPEFTQAIEKVDTLRKIELCRCPSTVVEQLANSNPQLEVINAVTIKDESMSLEPFSAFKNIKELRLKSTGGMALTSNIDSLKQLTSLKHLSLTSVRQLHKMNLDVIAELVNLESLDLGECSDFPKNFGEDILSKLTKLEKLRLEKGQGTCHTCEILDAVKDMPHLEQLELVNFDIKAGFDKSLGACLNVKKLLIIPTYISQSATTNHLVLGGVLRLHKTLSHFVWGVTLELLRVTELFVDQCDEPSKEKKEKKHSGNGDSIPVLKPVPTISEDGDEIEPAHDPPQVEILPLPNLQKLLLQSLPTTRVKILKIPFHATWRQSITDSVN